MSLEELEQITAAKRAEENKKRISEKEQYEKDRDNDLQQFVSRGIILNQQLAIFKTQIAEMMEKRKAELDKYGKIPSNSKGGFSLTSSDGTIRIVRTRSTRPEWDERSDKAVDLIREFLQDTVKKKDLKLYEILISFIAHDKEGNLEYNKVMSLIQHKDKYNDPRWLEGLQLILESYQLNQTGYGFDLMVRNSEKKWQRIELSFPSIQLTIEEPNTANDENTI